MKTLKLTSQQKEKLFFKFAFQKYLHGVNSFFWSCQTNGITMHFYSNYKLLIQGTQEHIDDFLEANKLLLPVSPFSFPLKQKQVFMEKDKIPYFGGDESGVGDLFGPIVITAVYLDQDFWNAIQALPIQDSKQLNDQQIRELAPKLMKYSNNFSAVIVTNDVFNRQFGHSMNLKELITFYYVQVLDKFVPGTKYNRIIIDGYINLRLFTKYCSRLSLIPNYHVELVEKAENKHMAVAAASIISRFLFLQEIDKISHHLQKRILLGANVEVKNLIQELYVQHGWEKLTPFVKLNYKGVKNSKITM